MIQQKYMTNIIAIQEEIKNELSNPKVMGALVSTTFKGLDTKNVMLAIQEGMLRGFKFADFLEKNVYAIPFRDGYSLVTSVDYARKVGMRSGVVGKSAPTYEEKDGKIISCTVTIKRKVNDYVGDYTATVFFDEYTTGRNLWTSKPRTMIAKVAEMHALRMACPEEMAQLYTEEEMTKENITPNAQEISDEIIKQVENAKDEKELKVIWEKNKGLGKDFAKMVVAQKKFLKDVAKTEVNEKKK
jgi:hypothetical protein